MTKNRSYYYLLCAVVAITNLSQLPFFVESGTTQYLSYLVWGFLAFCMVFMRTKISFKIIGVVLFMMSVILALGVITIATEKNYFATRIFGALVISIGVLCISHLIPENVLDVKEDLRGIYYVYIFTATIVAVVIYILYFQTGFDFQDGIYAYASKNSASQIVITAVVLSIFNIQKGRKFLNLAMAVCIVINVLVMFLMRSRASIIGLVVIIAMVAATRNIGKSVKAITLTVTAIFILAVIFIPEVYDVVVEDILFASRDSTDLNDLSSGRADQWARFPSLFAEHPFLGRGPYKIESFPLSVLAQYGMFIGGAIIIYSVYPAIYAFLRKKETVHHYILLTLCFVYLLNGLFEELSPFGPGVKCYFIWFMLGILLRSRKNEKQRELSKSAFGTEDNK